MSSSSQKAVCNINTGVQPNQPQTPPYPSIPLATDLPSALNAINNMRLILQGLTNQLPTLFPNLDNPRNAKNGQPGGGGGGQQGGNFTEVPGTRQTKTVKVTNPQDSTQFVMVDQITAVTFANKTGQTLTWTNGA